MIHFARPFRSTRSRLVVTRAGTRAALRQNLEEIARHVAELNARDLTELQGIIGTQSSDGDYCVAIVCDSTDDLLRKIDRAAKQLADDGRRRIQDRSGIYFQEERLGGAKLAVLFPGEGSQYPGALADLAPEFPEVAALVARRSAEETSMWEMLPAIAMVLTSDMALFRVLQQLGVRPDAVAGHSTGEIAALMASGMIANRDTADVDLLLKDLEPVAGPELFAAMPPVKLIAIGADQSVAQEIIAGIEPKIRIAMNNCPHQTVIVGDDTSATVAIERMRQQGIVFEVLPFDRPYHTDLCAPLGNAVRGSYAKWIDALAVTPIYSCTRSCLFPDDLSEARALASDQWTSRVEFPRTIERMYADGFRIFVESGPRGNLSAFVADILKGRPHAAIPANVPHRSGPDQLLHLMAELSAHGVPLVRSVGRELDGAILSNHHAFMSRFFEAQQRVMLAYMEKANTSAATLEPLPRLKVSAAEPVKMDVAAASHMLPVIGTILSYRPGEAVVALRDFNVDDDIFLRHHTFGREVSDSDPSLSGLPIVPLTMSIEMMAEAASLLVPSMSVVGIDHIRALRWATSDTGRFTLRVEARLTSTSATSVDVMIFEHDSASVDTVGAGSLLADATIRFAMNRPPAPRVRRFEGNPSLLHVDRQAVYRDMMFHGPAFQGFHSMDAIADDGAAVSLEVLSRDRLFLSNSAPTFVTDPILLDSAGQVLGVWMHYSGGPFQMAFPLRIGSIEIFADPPAVGQLMSCTLTSATLATAEVAGDLDIVFPDGQLWGRINGWESRRFDVPAFYTRQWFAPRQYLLCQPWNDARALAGPENDVEVFRVSTDSFPPGYFEAVGGIWLRSLAHTILSRRERELWRGLKGPLSRRTEWLLGRSAAKDAVRSYLRHRFSLTVPPADIELEVEPSGQLRPTGSWASQVMETPKVSISHSAGTAVAIVAGESHEAIGIDIEHSASLNDDVIAGGFNVDELELIASIQESQGPEWPLRIWCAKEAAVKAIGTGFRHGPRSAIASSVSSDGTVVIVIDSSDAGPENRVARRSVSVSTSYDGELALAVCSIPTSMKQGAYERNEQFA